MTFQYSTVIVQCDNCERPTEIEAKAVYVDAVTDMRTLCEVCQTFLPPGTQTLHPEARRV